MTSIIHSEIDIESENILFTENLMIDWKNSLTTLRGHSFFTSAFALKTQNQHILYRIEDHYDRLLLSYKALYAKEQLPFTFDSFKSWVQQTLLQNSPQTQHLSVIIQILGGAYTGDIYEANQYASGFSGDISKILMAISPLNSKPTWTFDKGINVKLVTYQRPLAEAKTTSYTQGMLCQRELEKINIETIKKATDKKNIFPNLLHEVVYISNDGLVLEGPSFAVFSIFEDKIYLNQNKQLLDSISIKAIEACAKKKSISIVKNKFTKDCLQHSWFAVSNTRLDFSQPKKIRIQPIHSVDGVTLPVHESMRTSLELALWEECQCYLNSEI